MATEKLLTVFLVLASTTAPLAANAAAGPPAPGLTLDRTQQVCVGDPGGGGINIRDRGWTRGRASNVTDHVEAAPTPAVLQEQTARKEICVRDVPCLDDPCPAPDLADCNDGRDNDGAEGTDLDDPDCSSRLDDNECDGPKDYRNPDGDGVNNCEDPDLDGDRLSNALEERIRYDASGHDGDRDGIRDAVDLVPGRDANVKVWVRIVSFDQVDWDDVFTGPDTYLRSHAGLAAWDEPNDPASGNQLSFDELRKGDHLHDEVGTDIAFSDDQGDEDDPTKDDFTEVAASFSQTWTEADYTTISSDGKIDLRWVLPLYDHDADGVGVHSKCDGDCNDEPASDLDTTDVWFELMSIATEGHHPGLIDASAETTHGVDVGTQTLRFGDDYTLRVEVAANVDECSLLLARHESQLGSSGHPDLGNPYVSGGEAAENGQELSSVERDRCALHTV